MTQIIIYNTDIGIAIVNPAPDCGLTVQQVALKDVPIGKPFKIISASDVPEDIVSWSIDDTELTDGIGTGV